MIASAPMYPVSQNWDKSQTFMAFIRKMLQQYNVHVLCKMQIV